MNYYELKVDVQLTIWIGYLTNVGVYITRTWVSLQDNKRIRGLVLTIPDGVQQELNTSNF